MPEKFSKRVLAGIPLYNPRVDVLLNNIQRISSDIDKVLLVDNASGNIDDVKKILVHEPVDYILHSENKGLPITFNEMIEYAIKNKYDYLLLLDQDSKCADDMVKELTLNADEHHVCHVPLIIHNNSNYQNKFGDKANGDVEDVDFSINSGTLINLNLLPESVRFNEKLFVDCVDFDFFLQLKKASCKTARINTAKIYVNLGNISQVPLLGFFLYNYSPFRLNKQIKDRIHFIKNNRMEPVARQTLLLTLFNVVMICLFEKNKFQKMKAVLRGLCQKDL